MRRAPAPSYPRRAPRRDRSSGLLRRAALIVALSLELGAPGCAAPRGAPTPPPPTPPPPALTTVPRAQAEVAVDDRRGERRGERPAPRDDESPAEPDWMAGVQDLLPRRAPAAPELEPSRREPSSRLSLRARGEARLPGAISRAAIRDGIRSAIPAIRRCYEDRDAEREGDDPVGRATLRFVITAGGAVEDARVFASGGGPRGLFECVEEALEAVTFPPTPGGGLVQVTYPLLFESGDGGS